MSEQDIFVEAISRPDSVERRRFLDQACGDDEALRARMEKLIRHSEGLGSFLEHPPEPLTITANAMIDAEVIGNQIGPYRIREQLGEGGFGTVFLAEQERPVRRRVALKIIKPGMDTREVIARFEAERQALAMMDHPNIAKVHDAGATENGRPYFVMELVRGVPITEYCDQCNLTTRERLGLFVSVCLAVQHAHQKGVIHRDIKPTNVLVAMQDGKPAPKIIDFGVAKAIGERLTERTLTTAFAQMVGTPLYMSPEQAELSPLGVDTRSDIYSLGVMLYELLTGATPFDKDRLHAASYDELRRIIREEEPPRPSSRLSTLAVDRANTIAERRRTDARRLRQTVHGELDWIAMKCLEKDRNRRYETPSSLARDVERYLHDEPVQACPPSASYRLKKLVRRNKVIVIAGSAIAAALIVGLTAASTGFIQARRQAEIARAQAIRSDQVAQFLKDTLAAAGPSVARGRDATLLREILEKTAQRVDKELQGQPEVQGDLWSTLGGTYSDIGDHGRAMTCFQRAVDSYRLAFGQQHAKLALALTRFGAHQSYMGDVTAGKKNAALGLEMARSCGDPAALADCLMSVARSFDYYGMASKQSVPYLREALALRRQIGAEPVALASCMQYLASNLGGSISPTDQEKAEAEALHRESLALKREHLESNHPAVAHGLYNLGQTLLKRGKFDEAEIALREAVDRYRTLHDDNHPTQSMVRNYLAAALVCQDKWHEAESVARPAAETSPSGAIDWALLGRINAYRSEWATAAAQFLRAGSNYEAAVALLEAGRVEEYRELSHRCLRRQSESPGNPDEQRAIAFLLLPMHEGDVAWIEQITNASSSIDVGVFASRTRVDKALAAYRLGRFDDANRFASPAVIEGARLPNQAQMWFIQALANARLQRTELARSAFAEGDKLLSRFAPAKEDDLLWDWIDWAIAKRLRREALELLGGADQQPAADAASAATEPTIPVTND